LIASVRGSSRYKTINLIRIDPLGVNRVRYVGSVHEALGCSVPWYTMIEDMIVGCYNNYGHKGYRSKDPLNAMKDVMYLMQDDKVEPNNARTTYYLAMSMINAGLKEAGIDKYIKRGNMKNSWIEERYMAWVEAALNVDRDKPDGDVRYLECLYKAYDLGCNRFEA